MMTNLHEGATIGTYRLVRPLGTGGMGEVWLGEHVMLGRRAAIKVLHATFSSCTEVLGRFFNEARAATAISDPGIVQVFDFGHHTDGSAYIVMELLEGESLERRWRTKGTLGIVEVLRLVRQIASSLGAAHARGIVHRDLKPENIFIVPDPEVIGGERTKILDFGVAKLSTGNGGVRTQTGGLLGTPMFMSPEQCRGAGEVDQRSDVYSLGCLMFLLLAGRSPFQADGLGELLIKHINEEPPRLGSITPLPDEVDALVARCLAKDPARRPQSGQELADALGLLFDRYTQRAVSVVSIAPIAPSATQPSPSPSPARRNRALAIAFVAVIATVIASAAMFGGGSTDAPRSGSSVSEVMSLDH